MNDIQQIIAAVIIGAIVIFLICRELMCWYWKINRIIALLEEQNNLLKRQLGIPSEPPLVTEKKSPLP
jgi:hypothetical protein